MSRSNTEPLTPKECSKLLAHLAHPPGGELDPRLYHRNFTMALIMLDTGCRVGELVQLHRDQLWFASAAVGALAISADQAKNHSERTIPITARLSNAIENMQRWWWSELMDHGTQFAFYKTEYTAPLTTRQVQRIISTAGKASLGRPIHPHLLRHTFATRLMSITSMRVVQQLLGHSSITSTQIYTHPNNVDYQKAIDKLNETDENLQIKMNLSRDVNA